MSPPVGTRFSMRATKGQTTKYDDFVQQITLKPGTYASDGNNLYMLEDIGNMSNMMNMLKAIRTWQQKNNQNWSPDAAYVQQLTFDSHHQTPGRQHTGTPTLDMTSQQSNVMNINMMNSNIMTNTGRNMMYTNALTNTMQG